MIGVSVFVIVIAAASAIATVVSTVATATVSATAVRRGKASTKSPPPAGQRRSDSHGAFPNADPPAILSPPQDLSVFRRQCPEDRLQGRQALAALCLRARQDRAESDYGGFRQEAAGAGAGHQTRPLSGIVALCDPLADDGGQTTEHRRPNASGRAKVVREADLAAVRSASSVLRWLGRNSIRL